VAASCLRGLLVPDKGSRFLCADFSAIEARAVAWLAGESKIVDAFARGVEIYKMAADQIYHVGMESVTDAQRQAGKTAILACGYGGGHNAFQKMAKNYKVKVDENLAKDIVKKWREANKNIVRFWYETEGAAIKAVQTGKPQQCRSTWWGLRGPWLLCRLPSGRLLHYFHPALEEEEHRGRVKLVLSTESTNSYTRKWTRAPVWGGLLVENITQAVCRDIMAEAMLRVEKAGYPVVLTVHDEVLVERATGQGSLAEYERVIAQVPSWACGMPIAAHGWEGFYYRKD